MTTTDLYSGYTGDGKPSSRVLRPPGGQSSNIFGGDEPPAPQQQQRRPEQVQFAEDNYQNNAAPAAPAHSNPTSDAQNEYQRNRPTGRAEAPFAMFEESGKHSQPTQFNQCDETSQKDADFGRYSVSAYRDAVQRNAAIRERARGQATGLVNPITHEDSSAPHPYENGHRAHAPAPAHAAQSQEQPQRMVRGQRKPSDKVQYNPITGEEYPADYGQQGAARRY